MGDSDVLNRNSFNYTIAIYDADKDLLYYCEYDPKFPWKDFSKKVKFMLDKMGAMVYYMQVGKS